jgi:hypothetical protein
MDITSDTGSAVIVRYLSISGAKNLSSLNMELKHWLLFMWVNRLMLRDESTII